MAPEDILRVARWVILEGRNAVETSVTRSILHAGEDKLIAAQPRY